MTTIDDQTRSAAMLVSSVLLRSFALGACLLAVACIPILLMTDQIYALHSSLIEIPRPEFNAVLYSWLGNLKLLIIVLLLLPAISIRWALKAN